MKKNTLYKIIYNDLLNGIQDQTFPVGSRLPSESQLSEQYSVSRITSKKALELLEGQGLISRMPGKGSFVIRTETKDEQEVKDEPEKIRRNIANEKKLIGVVMEGFGASFGHQILLGIEGECRNHDISLVLKCSYGSEEKEIEAIDELLDLGAIGIIIMFAHGENYNAKVLQLVLDGYPIVSIDRRLKGLPVPFVGIDNYQASYDLTKYLLEQGYKNICFVSSNSADVSSLQDREDGFITCCVDHGVLIYRLITNLISTVPISRSDESLLHDINSIHEFIKTHEMVDSFIAVEYDMAKIIYKTLYDIGIHEKYPIVCFDSIPNILGESEFTHIRQDEILIGTTSVKVLMQQIQDASDVSQHLVPYKLIESK